MTSHLGRAWAAIVCSFALAAPLLADLPVPQLHGVRPMGAAAGSTVELEISGGEDQGAERLVFDHPGIVAEFLSARKFKVSVGAEVPAGTYDVRFVGRFGVSSPRLFQVSRQLAEVAETEPNNGPETAQEIKLRSVVNAVSDSNELDVFRFSAVKGQRIVLDCVAGRLDSQLDAVMTLATADGQILATNSDYFGRDPLIDFQAPADGQYLVSVSDLSYRGGFFYRFIATDAPQIENVEPRALTAGKPTELLAYGRNLGSGAQKSARVVGDLPLDALPFSVQAPVELLTLGEFRFIEHPVDFSVVPTAATVTLVGYQVVPPPGDSGQRAQTMVVGADPVVGETEPNDQPDKPQIIAVPALVSGRFDQPRDVDVYEFDSGAGGSFAFEVYCERIGGRADPYLIVQDRQGNNALEADDFGHRYNAFDGHLRDPVGMADLKPHEQYRVLVADRYGRGGARLQYVLSVHPKRPDFFVAVIHRQNPGPAGLNVWRGGAEYLDVVLHRTEGQQGPVTIEAEGLPPGVHAAATTIQGGIQNGTFVFWSDRDAPVATQPVRLVARGKRGEENITRLVRPYTRVWPQPNPSSSRPTRELLLSTCEEAPLRVTLEPAAVRVEAGQVAAKVEVKAVATRQWAVATQEIRLVQLGFHPNFAMAETTIPAGAGAATLAITVGAGTPPGDYTMGVQCQSHMPYSSDPQAATKPDNLVTFPSLPVTITVTAPPQK